MRTSLLRSFALSSLAPIAAASVLSACGGGESASVPGPSTLAPDLATTLLVERNSALPNQENVVTVVVRNIGTAPSGEAILRVPAVSGFTYETVACSASTGVSCPTSFVLAQLDAGLALGPIPVGGNVSFRLEGVTTGGPGTQLDLNASISVLGDQFASNNGGRRVVPIGVAAAPTLVGDLPPPTYPSGSEFDKTIRWINAERTRCGMGLLRQDQRLDSASDDHANYLATNIDNNSISDLTHTQMVSFPGFTGADALSRARHRMYPGSATDLIDVDTVVLRSFQELFGYATFHSLAFQLGLRDLGLGSRQSAKWGAAIQVATLGVPMNPTTAAETLQSQQLIAGDVVVTYPCGGEVLLRRNHVGNENPSPFPSVDLTTKGPPITISVRNGQTLLIREFVLRDAAGAVIRGTLLTERERPGQLARNQGVFIADAPLTANTAFEVFIRGLNDGQRFEKRFSFSTSD